MKKEVQAMVKRRRARLVPLILLVIAALIIIGILVLALAAMSNGPGLGLVRTATPTASLTPTHSATPTTPAPTNTPADTPTATETAGPSPTPTQQIHTVAEGETLFSIAELYRANVCSIMAINNIVDAAVISVGATLIIPPPDYVVPTATPLPTDVPRGTVFTYVVGCGETLDEIAAKFNSTGTDIAERNDIDDPLSIQIGQVLEVRANIATPTPTATGTNTPPVTAPPAATATLAPTLAPPPSATP
ncbi:MAG: LysM peptidoglycan-binding domain-containing protein [Anaerolineales bacterium]|nr:LysM peptidoglycan-binding domain-containing protein [Anaerolineales bacterium]